jgi:N-acetylglutamate synthase-like GNAT family acetyltransferase
MTKATAMLDTIVNTYKNQDLISQTLKLYKEIFPPSEQENEEKIIQNISTQRYKMFAYKQDIVDGFYMLDTNQDINYMVLTFLGVREEFWHQGIGTQLLKHSIDIFQKSSIDFFFIEADEAPSKIYLKHGFDYIDIEYRIPCYDSKKTKKTNLMVMIKNKKLTNKKLKEVIKDMFIYGYMLEKDDKRLSSLLSSLDYSS